MNRPTSIDVTRETYSPIVAVTITLGIEAARDLRWFLAAYKDKCSYYTLEELSDLLQAALRGGK